MAWWSSQKAREPPNKAKPSFPQDDASLQLKMTGTRSRREGVPRLSAPPIICPPPHLSAPPQSPPKDTSERTTKQAAVEEAVEKACAVAKLAAHTAAAAAARAERHATSAELAEMERLHPAVVRKTYNEDRRGSRRARKRRGRNARARGLQLWCGALSGGDADGDTQERARAARQRRYERVAQRSGVAPPLLLIAGSETHKRLNRGARFPTGGEDVDAGERGSHDTSVPCVMDSATEHACDGVRHHDSSAGAAGASIDAGADADSGDDARGSHGELETYELPVLRGGSVAARMIGSLPAHSAATTGAAARAAAAAALVAAAAAAAAPTQSRAGASMQVQMQAQMRAQPRQMNRAMRRVLLPSIAPAPACSSSP